MQCVEMLRIEHQDFAAGPLRLLQLPAAEMRNRGGEYVGGVEDGHAQRPLQAVSIAGGRGQVKSQARP